MSSQAGAPPPPPFAGAGSSFAQVPTGFMNQPPGNPNFAGSTPFPAPPPFGAAFPQPSGRSQLPGASPAFQQAEAPMVTPRPPPPGVPPPSQGGFYPNAYPQNAGGYQPGPTTGYSAPPAPPPRPFGPPPPPFGRPSGIPATGPPPPPMFGAPGGYGVPSRGPSGLPLPSGGSQVPAPPTFGAPGSALPPPPPPTYGAPRPGYSTPAAGYSTGTPPFARPSPFGAHGRTTEVAANPQMPPYKSGTYPHMYGATDDGAVGSSPAYGRRMGSVIDPTQIPRPQSSRNAATYDTSTCTLPPASGSNYIAQDFGNCSPRIMRSTLYQIPCSGDLLNTSGMAVNLVIQPLALLHPQEEPIQLVDFGEDGPVRCLRCKGYMNPFMKFEDQGRNFICSLCGHRNETPRHYQCNMGADGRRRDADERPELCRGTVDVVATQEFLVRPPMQPVYLFLIDVSANAVKSGATATTCGAVKRVLADFPMGSRTMVGVATFDATIHFYNLNKKLQQPHMMVVPDVEDVYVPIQVGLFVPVSEGVEHLETLLGNIPNLFADNPVQSSALGSAIKASFLALESTGGKLIVFQSVLPTVGLCALTPRDSVGRASEKEVHKLLLPANKNLEAMVSSFANSQVCVDLFLTTSGYVDIASLAVLPKLTGGQIYHYSSFSVTMDSAKLYNDLRWNVVRPQGMEAIMRVRCSQGLRVHEYVGNYAKRIADDLELPAIDCDKSIMVTFKYDDKFEQSAQCCFQSALLYTTMDGQRRIRVSTLSLPCSAIIADVFRCADLDAQFACMVKTAGQALMTTPSFSQVKEQTINYCVQSLYAYRKYIATSSGSGQLILPECLKFLPLYILALTKSVGFAVDARLDPRAYWLSRVASMSVSLAVPLVHPRMFAIHNLSPETLEYEALPPVLPLSSGELQPEGIYLLENGDDAFIYPGKLVSSDLLYQLFRVRSVNDIVTGQFVLEEFDNEPSRLLNGVMNEIRRQRSSYLRLFLLKRDDPLELLFHSFMVEDQTSSGPSYVEFLVSVHKQIQTKMQSGN